MPAPDRHTPAVRDLPDPKGEPDDTGEQVWEIRLGVHCTGAQARDLVDREAAEAYPELVEQAGIERRGRVLEDLAHRDSVAASDDAGHVFLDRRVECHTALVDSRSTR